VRSGIPFLSLLKFVAIFVWAISPLPTIAQIEVPQFGSGSSAFDGWVNMNGTSFSGLSFFPGSSEWTGPAVSNQSGSGDAELNKSIGSAFFATYSLYFLSFIQEENEFGGALRVSDATPHEGVRTIVLQIQIGEALGYDFYDPAGWPVLKLNGSTMSISPNWTTLLNRYQNGFFTSPETEEDEPIFINTYAFEWNIGADSTTLIEIDFSAVAHAQIYEMRLDQSTAVMTQSIFDTTVAADAPTLKLVSVGIPSFNGTTTTVVHSFQGDPSANFLVEYKEDLESPSWESAGTVSTGNGNFNVTFAVDGDRRAVWSQKMFFRATRQ
jgi:hypothetical protein